MKARALPRVRRYCVYCRGTLPAAKRAAGALYCQTYCRERAHDARFKARHPIKYKRQQRAAYERRLLRHSKAIRARNRASAKRRSEALTDGYIKSRFKIMYGLTLSGAQIRTVRQHMLVRRMEKLHSKNSEAIYFRQLQGLNL